MNDSYSEWNRVYILKEEPTLLPEPVFMLTSGTAEPSDNSYSKGMLTRTPELGSDAISLTNGSFPLFLVTSFLNLCLKNFPLLIASSERLYLVGVAFVDNP